MGSVTRYLPIFPEIGGEERGGPFTVSSKISNLFSNLTKDASSVEV